MGKGSKPRPIDKESFNKNYDKIFGKKKLTALKSEEELEQDMLRAFQEIIEQEEKRLRKKNKK
jgi:hypothetical protein